jgi:thioredoxin 2
MPAQAASTNVVRCEVCDRKNRVPSAATGSPRCGNCRAPLPWITEADDDTFSAIAEASAIPVLVDFWAPWCGPCRTVSPALESLAREMAGRLKLVKVNVDAAPKLGQRFEVRAIPTLLVMVDGQPKARQAGAAPEHVLRTWVEQALASANTSAS